MVRVCVRVVMSMPEYGDRQDASTGMDGKNRNGYPYHVHNCKQNANKSHSYYKNN